MLDLTHLHPMIVHFPIALLIVGFLADAIGLILKKDFFTKEGYFYLEKIILLNLLKMGKCFL